MHFRLPSVSPLVKFSEILYPHSFVSAIAGGILLRIIETTIRLLRVVHGVVFLAHLQFDLLFKLLSGLVILNLLEVSHLLEVFLPLENAFLIENPRTVHFVIQNQLRL